MHISTIISTRGLVSGTCYDVIYRWEDEIARAAKIPIVADERLSKRVLKSFGKNKLLRWISLFLPWMANACTTRDNCLVFELDVWRNPGFNKPNIIPCIVDFWERSRLHLATFWLSFRKCPAVLISSKEAYDFLKSIRFPLPIHHWALSIPDSLVSARRLRSEKKYDMANFGRENTVLLGFVKQYAAEHPDFTFLRKAKVDGHWAYVSLKDEIVAFADDYESYHQLMEQVKIGVYCTPGTDGSRDSTHGFSQVTPRFLEYLSAGCHVIARYPNNSDVSYYDLPAMCPNIVDYDHFRKEVDRMRREPIDVEKYMAYLSKHKTSARFAELNAVIGNLK